MSIEEEDIKDQESGRDGAGRPGGRAFDGRAFCRQLTTRPGVYRMLDARGEVLYVGKARSLRRRVSSYFGGRRGLNPRVAAMVAQVAAVEVTVTRSEGEALLLESNLIKELRPRYNVVLRDDKSYPWIRLDTEHPFPRLAFHRGARTGGGRYFGPYPNAGAVRQTLALLEKLFQLRSCEDGEFAHRTRPCLQHQIGRCTAPCAGRIEAQRYAEDVRHAVLFLEGRSQEAIRALDARMEEAAAALEFELAARYRDQIAALQRVQQRQYVDLGEGDIDVVAARVEGGMACVQVGFVRGGQLLGHKGLFPRHAGDAELPEVLAAFLAQYYLAGRSDRSIPGEVLVNVMPADAALIAATLSRQAGRQVLLHRPQRGPRARLVEAALDNAALALEQRRAAREDNAARCEALAAVLGLARLERIECFDVSHTRGEGAVASCVVFGREGPLRSDYRRFNLRDIAPGDDYAAMQQALTRRYARQRREGARLPDLVVIDGGRGQVAAARTALEELGIAGPELVGVAKGPARRAGDEVLVLADARTERRLPAASAALHLLQAVRDEAHRFAISGHRQRRARARQSSPLEAIPGIGAKRRRALIRHFGGLQGVARAGVEDLSRVPGISRGLAERIHEALHR